jgi:hypothetical protein
MNGYLGRCVEEFERVSEEIGFLPASLWASLIILMTIVGSIVMMVLAVLVLASSPLVLAIIWVASSKSRSCRKGAEGTKQVALDPWFSE